MLRRSCWKWNKLSLVSTSCLQCRCRQSRFVLYITVRFHLLLLAFKLFVYFLPLLHLSFIVTAIWLGSLTLAGTSVAQTTFPIIKRIDTCTATSETLMAKISKGWIENKSSTPWEVNTVCHSKSHFSALTFEKPQQGNATITALSNSVWRLLVTKFELYSRWGTQFSCRWF